MKALKFVGQYAFYKNYKFMKVRTGWLCHIDNSRVLIALCTFWCQTIIFGTGMRISGLSMFERIVYM